MLLVTLVLIREGVSTQYSRKCTYGVPAKVVDNADEGTKLKAVGQVTTIEVDLKFLITTNPCCPALTPLGARSVKEEGAVLGIFQVPLINAPKFQPVAVFGVPIVTVIGIATGTCQAQIEPVSRSF